MHQRDCKTITFIGAGNVATQLATLFHESGCDIQQVFSRDIEKAQQLAKKVAAKGVNTLSDLHVNSDIYLLAVKDDAIEEIAHALNLANKICVHTSGSVDMNALQGIAKNIGVFYPLQQFNINQPINPNRVPLLIEASNVETLNSIENFARLVFTDVQTVDSTTRGKIHIAAVMVNNFMHHIAAKCRDYASENGFEFELLIPLMEETCRKMVSENLKETQTGPARRNDKKVLEKHQQAIEDKHLRAIYKTISESISDYYNAQ